jgi:ribosomal protein L7/L12
MSDVQWSELTPVLAQLKQRLDNLEAQMTIVSASLGIPYMPVAAGVPEVPQAVIDLAHAGKTLQAIAEYRRATGAGLEDARAVVLGL